VVELAKVLTEANQAEVLSRFYGCSSQEAKEVVAALMPLASPPVRAVVTAVTVPKAATPEPTMVVAAASTVTPATSAAVIADVELVQSTEPTAHPARGVAPRAEVEPLTADLRRLHMTVSRQFLKKLDAARDGLSHCIPGTTAEQALEAALDLLLEKQARARGQVKKPLTVAAPASITTPTLSDAPFTAATPTVSDPLHRRPGPRTQVSAATRRAVWERDGGRCSWPLDSGGVCGSTYRLELDHVVPWARWSGDTVDDLRVVCHQPEVSPRSGAESRERSIR
jgi:hypothetical protein